MFRGRASELQELTAAWAGAESTVCHLSGPSGIGKTSLVAEAGRWHRLVHLHCPPLPAPSQREALALGLSAASDGEAGAGAPDGVVGASAAGPEDWSALFDQVLSNALAVEAPLVLVLDDAHRLTEARARIGDALSELLRRVAKAGRTVHVVLIGRGGHLPEPSSKSGFGVTHRMTLGPLTLREAEPFLPGSRPARRIRSWAVFGGNPARLKLLDPGVSVGTNLRRLVLSPGSRWARSGLEVLERSVQAPSRYVAIMRALAYGEADWSEIHEGVTDLTRSGQVAPYIARLVELGLVEVRRSLDVGARSRNRRYRIRDPFHQFWFRFLLDHMESLAVGGGAALWSDRIKTELDSHIETVFPEVCRQYMRTTADGVFGANAREAGSLWGAGYELPVSGLLSSGAAFHGKAMWARSPDGAILEALDHEIRETRYGFGRERRLRVVFYRRDPSRELERADAQRSNVVLVGPKELLASQVEVDLPSGPLPC